MPNIPTTTTWGQWKAIYSHFHARLCESLLLKIVWRRLDEVAPLLPLFNVEQGSIFEQFPVSPQREGAITYLANGGSAVSVIGVENLVNIHSCIINDQFASNRQSQ